MYEYTGRSVAVFQVPLDFTCSVMIQVALEAFVLKLALADTLPFVLLILEAPAETDVVDIGEISAPSVHVPGLFIGSAVEVSAANSAVGMDSIIAAASANDNNFFFIFLSFLNENCDNL